MGTHKMRKGIKTTGIIAGVLILVALTIAPACALGGSMGPARMTLHTEIPFMSQDVSVIEVPIRVANTANESERVTFFTTDDLNNSEIMTVEFAENHLVLMPNEERVVDVTFSVKNPGTFSGNIVTMFNPLSDQSSSVIGSTVGLRLNSKVLIVAERKGPDVLLYSVSALGFVGIVVLIGLFLNRRRVKREREHKKFWKLLFKK